MHGPRTFARRILRLAAALCALLALAPGSLSGRGGPARAGGGLPAGVAPLPAELAVRLEGLLRATEERRGLKALAPVPAGVVSERAMRRQMAADFRHELPPERLAPLEAALKAFGLIPERMDLGREYLELLGRQVGGYYDPERRYLALVRRPAGLPGQELADEGGGGADLARRDIARRIDEMVIVHELTHALQDQHFHLQAFTGSDPLSDAGTARGAVVEGDATLTMVEYLKGGLGGREGADLDAAWASEETPEELAGEPAWLRDSLLFGYVEGYAFCASAHRLGGRVLLDRAFGADPPRSSEQILHPEKWHTRRDDPVAIPWPDLAAALPGARELARGELGELGIRSLLGPTPGDRRTAADAAAGWGGDRFAVWERGGKRILAWITEWDGEADAAEFAAAAARLPAGFRVERAGPRRVWLLRGPLSEAEQSALGAKLAGSPASAGGP